MYPTEEQFDDFKMAEETSEMESAVANTIVAKELTEVEQYKEEVLDEILGMADNPKDEQGYLKLQIATSQFIENKNVVNWTSQIVTSRWKKQGIFRMPLCIEACRNQKLVHQNDHISVKRFRHICSA